ncbi:hypothetical protein OKA05_27725 [Luteolibacter arcticus]|uniref:Uncharacterized protein n=1 Tax=Luteolibacter arcticus TaxID=1581411 RepID=A0ABT3GS91_9BACT|nr:hypothetical protein [Luteolibacter arcticus]MCW1926372.1 hypothetical protein [Luteolibacter arcticus]
MKTQFGFLAVGIGIGLGMGWMMGSSSASPDAPAMAAATKSDRPVTGSDASTAAGPDEKRATKRERPEAADKKPDEPKVMTFSSTAGGEMTPEMKEMFAKMEEQQKEARARKIDERLAALKSRLKLTPDQETKVRALLEASPDMGRGAGLMDAVSFAVNGSSGTVSAAGATSAASATAGNFNEQLQALLSPDQQEEFGAFQQEQKENRVEIATNREMTHLQQQLTLTPEQKDQAFQALGNVARNEAEESSGNRLDLETIKAAKQARVEAMRPILTPEQLKVYESNPATLLNIPEVTVTPGGGSVGAIQLHVGPGE